MTTLPLEQLENGVIRDRNGKMLVRLVFATEEIREVLFDALTDHINETEPRPLCASCNERSDGLEDEGEKPLCWECSQ